MPPETNGPRFVTRHGSARVLPGTTGVLLRGDPIGTTPDRKTEDDQ
jgi:hypothetical protein